MATPFGSPMSKLSAAQNLAQADSDQPSQDTKGKASKKKQISKRPRDPSPSFSDHDSDDEKARALKEHMRALKEAATSAPPKKKHKNQAQACDVPTTDSTAGLDIKARYQAQLGVLEKNRDDWVAKNPDAKPVDATNGVFVMNVGPSTSKLGLIAGYLNLYNGSQFGTIFTALKSQLDRLIDLHNTKFGYPKVPAFKADVMFTRLKAKHVAQVDVESTAVPDKVRYPTHDPNQTAYFYLCLLRFAHQARPVLNKLVEDGEIPAIFTGSHDGEQRIVMGWQAEDLFRCLMVWIAYKVKTINNKVGKGGEIMSSRASAYNTMPQLPAFASTQARKLTEGEKSRNQAALQAAQRSAALLNPEDLINEFRSMPRAEDADAAGKALDQHVTSTDRPFVPAGLDPIDPVDLASTMMAAAGPVTYLYKEVRRQDKTFFRHTAKIADKALEQAETLQVLAEGDKREGEAKDDPESVARRKRFLDLQACTAKKYAKAPSWEESKGLLKLEIVPTTEIQQSTKMRFKALYHGLELKVWQPPAIAWLAGMLESEIGCPILADDVGLRKTVSSLCAIVEVYIRGRAVAQEWNDGYRNLVDDLPEDLTDEEKIEKYHLQDDLAALGPRPVFRPFLIVVPPQALNSWRTDIRTFFSRDNSPCNIQLRTLCSLGGKSASKADQERAITGGRRGLKQYLAEREADKYSPENALHAILTTYQSWQSTTLPKLATTHKLSPKHKGRKQPRIAKVDEELDDEADAEDESEEEDTGPEMEQSMPLRAIDIPADSFSIVAIDEAHRVQHASSLQTSACFQLKARYILITATPIKGYARDFHGLLRFVYKNIKPIIEEYEEETGAALDVPGLSSYQSLGHSIVEKYGSNVLAIEGAARMTYLRCLDPVAWKSNLAGNTANPLGDLSGADMIPLVQAMVVLRRGKGEKMLVEGDEIILAKEIPPFRITTVELQMPQGQLAKWLATAEDIAQTSPQQVVIFDDDDSETVRRENTNKRRRYTLATNHTLLDQFSWRNIQVKADTVHALNTQSNDAFSFFFRSTINDFHHAMPDKRVNMANYICRSGVKYAALTVLLANSVVERKEKVIIWCHEPLTMFLVETLLSIFDIPNLSIRAGISNANRVRAEDAFNNDPLMRVLNLSSRSSQESMNLQKGGHIHIVMDVVGHSSSLQMMGRSHRIGQDQECEMYILTNDCTFDNVLQAGYWARFRDQMAAQVTISAEHIQFIKSNMPQAKLRQMEQTLAASPETETTESFLLRDLRGPYADAMMRELFGVRSTRTPAWGNSKDFFRKNLEPEEILFNFALGGNEANRTGVLILAEEDEEKKAPKKSKDSAKLADEHPEYEKVEPSPKEPTIGPRIPQPHLWEPKYDRMLNANGARWCIGAAWAIAKQYVYSVHAISPLDVIDRVVGQVHHPSVYISLARQTALTLRLTDPLPADDPEYEHSVILPDGESSDKVPSVDESLFHSESRYAALLSAIESVTGVKLDTSQEPSTPKQSSVEFAEASTSKRANQPPDTNNNIIPADGVEAVQKTPEVPDSVQPTQESVTDAAPKVSLEPNEADTAAASKGKDSSKPAEQGIEESGKTEKPSDSDEADTAAASKGKDSSKPAEQGIEESDKTEKPSDSDEAAAAASKATEPSKPAKQGPKASDKADTPAEPNDSSSGPGPGESDDLEHPPSLQDITKAVANIKSIAVLNDVVERAGLSVKVGVRQSSNNNIAIAFQEIAGRDSNYEFDITKFAGTKPWSSFEPRVAFLGLAVDE